MSEIVHVLTVNDIAEHVQANTCWCVPTIKYCDVGEGFIVIHNSLDGRELREGRGRLAS